MKLYLVQERQLKLKILEKKREFESEKSYMSRTGSAELAISAKDILPWNKNVESIMYKKLKEHINSKEIVLKLTLQECTWSFLRTPQIDINLYGDFLSELPKVLGAGLMLQVKLNNAKVTNIFDSDRTKRAKLSLSLDNYNQADCKTLTSEKLVCASTGSIFSNADMPKSWQSSWPEDNVLEECMSNLDFCFKISIILSMSTAHAHHLLLKNETMLMSRQLLLDEFATDLVIVGSNGTPVKCHKLFVTSDSEVIKAMLVESDLPEISINDLSENGIRALLAYMYYRGLDAPDDDPGVAVELLQAADKYRIGCLENAVKTVLLEKKNEWFSLDSILNLYVYLDNIQYRHRDLKELARKLIKLKKEEIISSPFYAQLQIDNQKAAKQISKI